ncbi:MAG: energy transducer TonB [Proteobacteria bacterium]|nr:energy transducer TonB [Pseudomonadota bacterium]
MVTRLSALILLTSSSAMAANPPAPVELEPVTVWDMHYADDSCKLRRDFGPPEMRLGIEFAQFAPGDQFQLLLIGKPLNKINDSRQYTIQFGDLPEHKIDAAWNAESDSGLPVTLVALPGLRPVDPALIKKGFEHNEPVPALQSPADAASANVIRISSKHQQLLLHTGPLSAPMSAMRKCMDEVVRSWGVDPSKVKTPARPIGNPGTWLTSNDYPSQALVEYKDGLVNFRLTVNETGKVSQCHILRAVNESLFAKTTCLLLTKRARFKPARDTAGNAIAGYFVSWVRFGLPPQY